MSIISLSNLSAVAMAAGMQFFSVIKSQSGLFASVSLNFYIDGCLIFYDHFVPCVKNPPVLLCFLTKHLFHFFFLPTIRLSHHFILQVNVTVLNYVPAAWGS